MDRRDVRCTDTHLVLLRPLEEMAPPVRRAVTTWLWAHGVSSAEVAVGYRIERDDVIGSVTWREERADGQIIRRWRFSGDDGDQTWPAPFPAAIRVDQAPDPRHGTTSTHG